MTGAVLESYWQGCERNNGLDGQRLMIVGESHYSEAPERERYDLTSHVVRHHIDSGNYSFFRSIEKIISGSLLDEQLRSRFWQAVTFMNFVPEVVPQYGRPNREQFTAGLPRFRAAVELAQPDLICFFSAAAWDWRPWGPSPWTQEAFGFEPRHIGGSYEVTDYDTGWSRRVTMARFNHPRGAGAPSDIWHVWYKHVAALAANKERQTGVMT